MMKNSRFVVLILLSANLLTAQAIKTLSLDFTRKVQENRTTEQTSGQLFYQASGTTILKISQPLIQWVIYDKNEMTIFYPNENSVFRIIYPNQLSIPFLQAFLGVTKEDFGLSQIGFSLQDYETKDKRLRSRWRAKKIIPQFPAEIIIEYQDNKLVYVEIKNSKNELINKTKYEQHFTYQGHFFPLRMSIVYHQNGLETIEEITFTNPKFNGSLPEEIIGFKLPANAKIQDIRW